MTSWTSRGSCPAHPRARGAASFGTRGPEQASALWRCPQSQSPAIGVPDELATIAPLRHQQVVEIAPDRPGGSAIGRRPLSRAGPSSIHSPGYPAKVAAGGRSRGGGRQIWRSGAGVPACRENRNSIFDTILLRSPGVWRAGCFSNHPTGRACAALAVLRSRPRPLACRAARQQTTLLRPMGPVPTDWPRGQPIRRIRVVRGPASPQERQSCFASECCQSLRGDADGGIAGGRARRVTVPPPIGSGPLGAVP